MFLDRAEEELLAEDNQLADQRRRRRIQREPGCGAAGHGTAGATRPGAVADPAVSNF
jgi:hypothetical protein